MNDILQYFVVAGFTSGFLSIALFIQRARWQKEADSHVQILEIPKAGKRRFFLGEIIGGIVTVKEDKKKGIPGKSWPIAEIATYEAPYPPEFPIAFMRTNIKEMAVYAWNWEPISNPEDNPLMSPSLLYNFEHEKFSQIFLSTSQLMAEQEAKLQKALSRTINPNVVYVLIGLSIIVSGIGSWMIYSNILPVVLELQPMMERIEFIAKAFGG